MSICPMAKTGRMEGNNVFRTNAWRCLILTLAVLLAALPCRAQDEEEFVDGDPAAEQAFDEIAAEDASDFPPEEYAEEDPPEMAPEEEPQEEPYQEEYQEEAPAPEPPQRPARNVIRPARPRPIPSPRTGSWRRPGGPEDAMPKNGGESSVSVNPETETVSFDFDGIGLLEVVEKIARLTGRNFDVDPSIAETPVTVLTHQEIPVSLAYQVLESILATRGFAMVPDIDGHLIKILPSDQAMGSEKTEFQLGSREVGEGYDNLATHVITVEYADASELATALKILGSDLSQVDTYAPTNTLIITDTADGLRRMFAFLDVADVAGFDTIMEIFTLEFARAEVLAQQLEEVLMESGTASSSASRTSTSASSRIPRRPTRTSRPVPGSASPQVIGSREDTLRMVSDERLNALIVLANEGMMERVRDLIARLDTPTPIEKNNLHIYELLNADVTQVEEAIRPLLGMSGGGRTSSRTSRTSSRTSSTRGTTAPSASSSSAAGALADVQPFEQKVYVSSYEQTNSLLVVASPQDYRVLEGFIANLDVPPRQVMVDAVVMDVTIANDYGVSVDAASITGEDGFGMTSTSNLSTLAAGLQSTADAATSIVGGPGAALAAGVLGQGNSGGLTAGIFDDISVDVGGYDVDIPFVPLLFKAIETISDLEVLSQPSIVTVDNEEASFVVGQEVPFITNTSRPSTNSDGQVLSAYSGYTRVQREEVGVKLTVTPQISEGDNLLLDIEIEVSDVASQGRGRRQHPRTDHQQVAYHQQSAGPRRLDRRTGGSHPRHGRSHPKTGPRTRGYPRTRLALPEQDPQPEEAQHGRSRDPAYHEREHRHGAHHPRQGLRLS